MASQMKKLAGLLLFLLGFSATVWSQNLFPERCEGDWKGLMRMYKDGEEQVLIEDYAPAAYLQNLIA